MKKNKRFDDLIMDIWTNSEDENELKNKIDELGNKLLDMKNQYVKIKNVDEEIFGNLFEAREDIMSDLQRFVIKFFNTLGAAVEEVDYALIDVLIDDEFKNIFGKTELKLCFDYEVYLENPKYELVTFGSFILDKIIDLSFQFSNTCIRYAIVDNLNVTEPEKKIKKFLNLDRTNVEIIEENKVINYFVKYSFKVTLCF